MGLEFLAFLTGEPSVVAAALRSDWAGSALLGAGIILLGPASLRIRFGVAGLAGAATAGMFAWVPGLTHGHLRAFASCLAVCATAAQLMLLMAHAPCGPRHLRALSRAALLVGGVILVSVRAEAFGALNPTYDAGLFNFDQHLGLRLGVLLDHWMMAVPMLKPAMGTLYMQTPAIIALYDAGTDGHARPPGLSMTATFLITGVIGTACYHIVPVAGPTAMPLDYYGSLWATGLLLPSGFGDLPLGPPRTSMPSLHATWGYLLVLNAGWQPTAAGRSAMRMVGAATALSALAVGGHWLIDLVVAVPFTVAVRALLTHETRRRRELLVRGLGAGLLVAAWFAAIRLSSFEGISTCAAWASLLATCAASWAVSSVPRRVTREAGLPYR